MPFLRIFRFFSTFFFLLLAGFPAFGQLNSQEQAVANLMAHAGGQQRSSVTVDPILSRVARARAADMARRNYFGHVNPDGIGANYLIRQAGYPLPSSYSTARNANNVESIAAGTTSANETWSMWMASSSHKKHLLGLESFYAEQTSIGVGYYYDSGSEYHHYWVVISAPPPGPSLTISSPAANAGLKEPQVTISGATGGTPAATKVVVRLENASGTGAFVNASGAAKWSATFNGLVPGPNTLRVRSLDASGATLQELTRTVRYVVLKPLIVATEGSGTVTKGFEGTTQRELGAPYKINAKPATGWLFDHWSGSAESTQPVLSFVMAEGFQLTAVFRVNPFYALRNTYTGLAYADSLANDGSGLLKITTTATGGFSGRVTFAGRNYTVRGKFDEAGNAVVTVKRGALPPLTVNLHLDVEGLSGGLTGSITDGTLVATFEADPATSPKERHPAAGRYTLALPPNANDSGNASIPQGTSIAVITVNPAGVATVSGSLADGTNFTVRVNVAADGFLPIYAPLYGSAGSLLATLSIDPQSGAIGGNARWSHPETPRAPVFREAFATTLAATGARYVAPAAGTAPLQVAATIGNSALHLSGGDLMARVDQTTTLLPTSRVSISDPQLANLTLTITAANGKVTGRFKHPVTGATSVIRGIVLQDRNLATGFFLGRSQSGPASLAPR